MATITIPNLPPITAPTLTDVFPVDQTGTTYKETCAQLQTLFGFVGGVLPVSSGGTGLSTSVDSAVLVSNFTGQPVWTTALQSGQIVIGSLDSVPVAAYITAGSNITITNGPGSISIASTPITATGTFTPGINFGGAGTGITYTTQIGTYTQIGNLTYFVIDIVLTSKGSATGNATITGLPITTSGTYFQFIPCVAQNITFLSTTPIIGQFASAGTTISLLNQVTNSTFTNYTDAQFSNTSTISVQGFYY